MMESADTLGCMGVVRSSQLKSKQQDKGAHPAKQGQLKLQRGGSSWHRLSCS